MTLQEFYAETGYIVVASDKPLPIGHQIPKNYSWYGIDALAHEMSIACWEVVAVANRDEVAAEATRMSLALMDLTDLHFYRVVALD